MLDIKDTARSSTSFSIVPSPFFFSLVLPMKIENRTLSPKRPPFSSVKLTNWSTAGAYFVIAKSRVLRAAARAVLFFRFRMRSMSCTPSASTNSCLFSGTSRHDVSTSKLFSMNSSSSWLAGFLERYGATEVSIVSMPPWTPSRRWFLVDVCVRIPRISLTDCFTLENSRGFRRDSSHLRILVFSVTVSTTSGFISARFSTMLSVLNTPLASSSLASSKDVSRCTSSSSTLFSSRHSTRAPASSSASSIASASVSSRMRSTASAAMSVFSCLRRSRRVGTAPRLTSSGYSSGLPAMMNSRLISVASSTSLSMKRSGCSECFMRIWALVLNFRSKDSNRRRRPLPSSSSSTSSFSAAASSACRRSSSGSNSCLWLARAWGASELRGSR
mmetsp:Transcript_5196/g.14545  ORF Transcript_5196/g.14545 Transcript_5196/m.14545 type:complete len:387 (-) Transcript_5196:566-1726(-)